MERKMRAVFGTAFIVLDMFGENDSPHKIRDGLLLY